MKGAHELLLFLVRSGRSLRLVVDLPALLDEFASLRRENLARLREWDLTAEQLGLTGTHPALGAVTVRQLMATWTAHDLGHILQITRTMARKLKSDVGPWKEYLSVMSR